MIWNDTKYHVRKCPAPKSVVIGGWVWWSCWAGRSLQRYQQSSLICFSQFAWEFDYDQQAWHMCIYIYIHDDHWCIYLIMYTYIIHISPHTYPKSYRHRYWWQQRSLEYFRRLTRHCLSGWFGSDLPSLLAASPLGEAFFQKLQINKKMHIGEA